MDRGERSRKGKGKCSLQDDTLSLSAARPQRDVEIERMREKGERESIEPNKQKRRGKSSKSKGLHIVVMQIAMPARLT